MMITTKDYKNILDIIDTAYTIPDRKEMFSAVFEKPQKVCPFTSAVFMPTSQKIDFKSDGAFVYNVPEKLMRLFEDHYAPLHPCMNGGNHLFQLNAAIRITDVISPHKLAETEYSRDFQSLHPIFYEMPITFASQGVAVGVCGLHRTKKDRDFSDREKEIATLLAPHLSRAIHHSRLLEEHKADEIGIIMVGNDGRPVKMNPVAKEALNGREIGEIPDPGISAASAFFYNGKISYRVKTVSKAGDEMGKIIFLEPFPPGKTLDSRLSSFALSRRQREIAAWVIRGLSNKEIAERLFITGQTVKDHLRHIYEITGVHKRSQLTAKVIGLSG